MKELTFREKLIEEMTRLEIDPGEVGRLLKISTPTILRWLEGKSEPHTLVQENLIRQLENSK